MLSIIKKECVRTKQIFHRLFFAKLIFDAVNCRVFFFPMFDSHVTTATPVLSPQELKQMGYTMAAYPLTLLSASIKAMIESLDRIQQGLPTDDIISTFSETKDVVGFTKYASEEQRYKTD